MLRKLLEERKYRKKYNALKIIYEDTLEEINKLTMENEALRKEIKEYRRERIDYFGITKQKLSNNKRLNGTNKHRKTSSTKDNGRSNSTSNR